MIENMTKLKELLNQYTCCQDCIDLQKDWENEAAFEKLISVKKKIPSELYATVLSILYCTDTEDVKYDTFVSAFEGTECSELMYANDLEKLKIMPNEIVIYRGTQDQNEIVPRLSWSLKYETAKRFGTSHLFKAKIKKEQVIAYYSKNGDEEEILAFVSKDFEMIY